MPNEITIRNAPVVKAYTYRVMYADYRITAQTLTVLATSSVDAFSKIWGSITDFEQVSDIRITISEVIA